MMYFSVLLLDTKELEQKEGNLWDVEQEENTGLIQWMNLATPLLSLLFFLLTAGLVAGSPHHHTGISLWIHLKNCRIKVQMGDMTVNEKSDDKSILLFTCQRSSVCRLCAPVLSLHTNGRTWCKLTCSISGFIAMGHVAAIRWMSLSSFKTEATQKPTASSSRETKSLP